MGMNIPWDIVITCVGFNILALLSLAVPELRHGLTKRNRSQWFIDIQGLLAQGLLIPLAKVYGLVFVLATLIPSWQQALHLPPRILVLLLLPPLPLLLT